MDYAILFVVFILFAAGNTRGLAIALIITIIRIIAILISVIEKNYRKNHSIDK